MGQPHKFEQRIDSLQTRIARHIVGFQRQPSILFDCAPGQQSRVLKNERDSLRRLLRSCHRREQKFPSSLESAPLQTNGRRFAAAGGTDDADKFSSTPAR